MSRKLKAENLIFLFFAGFCAGMATAAAIEGYVLAAILATFGSFIDVLLFLL